MPLPSPPPNWEANEISRFFDTARFNEFATFANKKGEVDRLSDIDLAYRKAIEGVSHSKDCLLASSYFVRTRTSWRRADSVGALSPSFFDRPWVIAKFGGHALGQGGFSHETDDFETICSFKRRSTSR